MDEFTREPPAGGGGADGGGGDDDDGGGDDEGGGGGKGAAADEAEDGGGAMAKVGEGYGRGQRGSGGTSGGRLHGCNMNGAVSVGGCNILDGSFGALAGNASAVSGRMPSL